jgi:hypothetical protein
VAIAIALGVPGAFCVLLSVVCYYEKRLFRPYAELPPDGNPADAPPLDLISPYVEHMSDGAMASGFEFGSLVGHRKYPSVKISGAVWLSRDRRTLLYTGSGTVLNMVSKQTWLFTRLRDDTWLITTDQNDEGDPTGRDRIKRVLNGRFDKLLSAHRKRLAAHPLASPFPPGRPFDLLVARAEERIRRMLKEGLVRARDEEYWSFSLKTSATFTLRFLKQLGGAIPQFWRVKFPPPASPVLQLPAVATSMRWRRAVSMPGASRD